MYAHTNPSFVKEQSHSYGFLLAWVALFWCLPAKLAANQGNAPCATAQQDLEKMVDPYDLLDTVFSRYLDADTVYLCYEQYFQQHYFDGGAHEQAFHNNRVNSRMMAGHWADARAALKAYYHFVNTPEHQADASRYWLTLGNFFFSLPEPEQDSAVMAYQKAIALTVDNDWQLMLLNSNLGSIYIQKEQYRVAYNYLNVAKFLAAKLDPPLSADRRAIMENNIGVTYIHRWLLAEADSIFQQAYNSIRGEDHAYARVLILINQAKIALLRDDKAGAIRYLEEAAPAALRYQVQLDQYYMIKLNVLICRGQFREARRTLQAYKDYCQQHGSTLKPEYQAFVVLLDLVSPNRTVSPYLLSAVADTYLETLDVEHHAVFFRCLQQFYLESGQLDAAKAGLEYYLRHRYEARIRTAASEHGELATLFNVRSLELERQSAKKQADEARQKALLLEENRRLLLLALGLAIAATVAMGLLFKSQRSKGMEVKKRMQLLDMHNLQLDKQLEVQRKNVIQMSIGVAQLDQALEEAVNHYAKKPEMLKRKVKILLHERLKEPSNFIEHFNLAYPEFFKALTERSGDWTNNQLRYALLFALGATTKEVAMTVGVSENTVNVNRYRLRQKLNFSGEDDLVKYLRNLLLERSV